jgi:hypothetical protein
MGDGGWGMGVKIEELAGKSRKAGEGEAGEGEGEGVRLVREWGGGRWEDPEGEAEPRREQEGGEP